MPFPEADSTSKILLSRVRSPAVGARDAADPDLGPQVAGKYYVSASSVSKEQELTRIIRDLQATSNKCTHYGAPLIKGVLTGSGRVVW